MKKHIHITGASVSGTTTLAKALSRELGYRHFDTDDYYWLPTELPYTTKRPVNERLELLKNDLDKAEKWILYGSNCSWGDSLIELYDLVIFLYVPKETRMERLIQREKERYPKKRISLGGDLYDSHNAFVQWAAAYDDGGPKMRSLYVHNEWLKRLKCDVIRIEGMQSVKESMNIVMNKIGK
ncbi:AAA family ATPase [Ruminiclostridium herbifermentans]|uniref:AAA family ATPase n=1 Tax=Ruminiclostridium herbifermentans TaxID=2488810 RepID=A0A4U7JJ01_9FIRM|nr:AAA family ATPase [Ruminiclostridium herbifermentans]QNU66014.1 AAA family ATPase [Ruminiclostridium herbifermentans]